MNNKIKTGKENRIISAQSTQENSLILNLKTNPDKQNPEKDNKQLKKNMRPVSTPGNFSSTSQTKVSKIDWIKNNKDKKITKIFLFLLGEEVEKAMV